jgi:enoyl-CoA hydratase
MMDGLVMGGGVGVGAHGSHRIVTEKSKIGMPEVGIGFIPDVGGTYLLSRAPRSMGLHAALTGAPFSGADSIALGFADYFVPHDRLGDLARAISADGVDAAIAEHAVKPPPSQLAQLHWITQCYAGDSVTDIVAALRAHAEQQANATAELISSRSPIALAVTLESVRRAADLPTLKDVLLQEYRVACTALNSHDLVEGIRARVIDKDRNAKWSPSSASDITAGDVDGYFANTGTDLKFDVVMD